MLYKVRFRPAFGTLFVTLNPKESIFAEVGSLVSMESGITVKTKLVGGVLFGGIRKLLGQKLLLIDVYTNKSDTAKSLVFSQPLLGDIERIDLTRGGICVHPDAYLAHTAKVRMKVRWMGLKGWLLGGNLFKLQFKGEGRVFIGSHGGMTKRTLYKDLLVDSGHLIAYEPTIRLKKPDSSQKFSPLLTRNNPIYRLKGKGIIYLQSRSFARLTQYLRHKN